MTYNVTTVMFTDDDDGRHTMTSDYDTTEVARLTAENATLRDEVARLTAELADVSQALADRLETAGLVCEWCGEGDDEGDEGLGMVVDGMHEACLTSSIEGGMATVLGRTNPST